MWLLISPALACAIAADAALLMALPVQAQDGTASPPSRPHTKDMLVAVDGRQQPWDISANPDYAFGLSDGQHPNYVGGFPLRPGSLIRIYAAGAVSVATSDAPSISTERLRSSGLSGYASPDRHDASPTGASASRTANELSDDEQKIVDSTKPRHDHATSTAMNTAPFSGSSLPPQDAMSIDSTAPRVMSGSSGPEGQASVITDGRTGMHGTRFPSYYIDKKHYPVRVNELIGAFVDADGVLVSRPFPVGKYVALRVPKGASAIALGLNSESFSINHGFYNVFLTTGLATVTVIPSKP